MTLSVRAETALSRRAPSGWWASLPGGARSGFVEIGAGLVPARQQEDRQFIEPFEDAPIRCFRRIGVVKEMKIFRSVCATAGSR